MTEVAPKEKIDKPKKKLPLPRKRYVLGFFSIVLICGVVAYLLLRDTRQLVDCVTAVNESSTQLDKRDYRGTLNTLNTVKEPCLNNNANASQKVTSQLSQAQMFTAYSNIAVASKNLGDQANAKVAAEQAVKLNQQMSEGERKNTPNQNQKMVQLIPLVSKNLQHDETR